jgi:hypothetical protein
VPIIPQLSRFYNDSLTFASGNAVFVIQNRGNGVIVTKGSDICFWRLKYFIQYQAFANRGRLVEWKNGKKKRKLQKYNSTFLPSL